MDHEQVKKKVLEILDAFGMSGQKAAEAMGVTYAVFRNKKNDASHGHTFNENNLVKLIHYIKATAEKL